MLALLRADLPLCAARQTKACTHQNHRWNPATAQSLKNLDQSLVCQPHLPVKAPMDGVANQFHNNQITHNTLQNSLTWWMPEMLLLQQNQYQCDQVVRVLQTFRRCGNPLLLFTATYRVLIPCLAEDKARQIMGHRSIYQAIQRHAQTSPCHLNHPGTHHLVRVTCPPHPLGSAQEEDQALTPLVKAKASQRRHLHLHQAQASSALVSDSSVAQRPSLHPLRRRRRRGKGLSLVLGMKAMESTLAEDVAVVDPALPATPESHWLKTALVQTLQDLPVVVRAVSALKASLMSTTSSWSG
jgi:hypothetical protein